QVERASISGFHIPPVTEQSLHRLGRIRNETTMSRIVMRSPLPLFRPETRSRRIAVLLGVLWLLAFADLFFTVWAHQFTRFEELNPIARRILHTDSLLAL